MKSQMPPKQKLSMVIGICLVGAVDFILISETSFRLSGPGLDGALRAGFWYGIIGCGGGLMAYEIVRRIKSR